MKDSEERGRSVKLQVLEKLLEKEGGCLVIDGGLATHLEHLGADINDPLWSALCLLNKPELITQVHLDYLRAGARVLITASYQATIPGFQSKGLSTSDAEALLRRSVELACEARDSFWKDSQNMLKDNTMVDENQQRALVAASVGSYGAYLADGSEYSGKYGSEMTLELLKEFHRRRLQVLTEAGPDLLAFETTPNKLEAQAYIELLQEERIEIPSWITFNSKDGVNAVSGDSFIECIRIADSCPRVVAVGVNCTPPRFIHGLILAAQKATTKPIIIYPNSGEMWDAEKKEWVCGSCDRDEKISSKVMGDLQPSTRISDTDFVSYVRKWREAGASLIGGCCRTTPKTIQAISEALKENRSKLNLYAQ